MTNAEKYLKDGVDVEEFNRELFKSCVTGDLFNFINSNAVTAWLYSEVKPILLEDEKVILKYINQERYAQIGRTKNGEIIFRNVNDSYCVLTPYFNFENIFQFIQPRRRI